MRHKKEIKNQTVDILTDKIFFIKDAVFNIKKSGNPDKQVMNGQA